MAYPYISPAELLDAELGISWRNLPPQGGTASTTQTGQVQYQQLMDVIVRASGLCDLYCFQGTGTLATTTDVEERQTGRHMGALAGIDNNGYLWAQASVFPVISISSFRYGFPALGGTTWTVPTLSDLLIVGDRRNRIVYPTLLNRNMPFPYRVQYTYLNGFPNTNLTAACVAGATSLALADLTGIQANDKLTIYDRGVTELVTVAGTYTPGTGAGSVTLAAGTQFAHTPTARPAPAGGLPYDIRVSEMPSGIKNACLLICKMIGQLRGVTSLTMGRAGGSPTQGQPQGAGLDDEIPSEAQHDLDAFRRIS